MFWKDIYNEKVCLLGTLCIYFEVENKQTCSCARLVLLTYVWIMHFLLFKKKNSLSEPYSRVW